MFAQTKYRSAFLTNDSVLLNAFIVVLSSVILGVISQVAVHLWWPVPITLQSAMVVLLGLTTGSKRAAAAVVLYLLEGAAGLPVFAGGLAGLPILIGPSAGYLWGFVPAAFFAGFLMEKGMARNVLTTFSAAIAGSTIIFIVGVVHLQGFVGWEKAYTLGVQPFLIIEPIKLLIASALAISAWKQA